MTLTYHLFFPIQNFSSLTYKNYQHSKLHRGVCGSKHCGMNTSHADAGESTAEALKNCLNATIHQGYGLQVRFYFILFGTTNNYITKK